MSLAKDDTTALDIDIIGFSRGAAQARDFANRLMPNVQQDAAGDYWYYYQDKTGKNKCQKVNFRFMGLWDTVLSTDVKWGTYNLRVTDAFKHVAHAVALNEHRGATIRTLPGTELGAFPMESILLSNGWNPAPTINQTRIERGFIGAHADIGGGWGANDDLSKVALTWMVEQAKLANVEMINGPSTIIANPVIHDKSDNQYARDTGVKPASSNEDRTVTFSNGSQVNQKEMTAAGMTWQDTQQFITYHPPGEGVLEAYGNYGLRPKYPEKPSDHSVGIVDMTGYLKWLNDSKQYTMGNLKAQ